MPPRCSSITPAAHHEWTEEIVSMMLIQDE